MASLDQFKPQQGRGVPTLQDFKIEGPLRPAVNVPSNRNLAAYTAVLSENPESVEATYLEVLNDLDNEGHSRASESILQRVRQESWGANRQALTEILLDEGITDDMKMLAAQEFLQPEDPSQPRHETVENLVSMKALSEPSEGETLGAEEMRALLAARVEEINAYRVWQQELLNFEASRRDPGISKKGVELFEMILPFAEPGQRSRIARDLRGTGGFRAAVDMVFHGEVSWDIRQSVRSLPPSERREFVEKLVDIVNDHPEIALPSENHMAVMHQLSSFLVDGYYETEDRIIDNIIGILDATLLGGVVSGGLVRPATRALRGADRAEAMVRQQRAAQRTGQMPDDALRAAENISEERIAQRQREHAAQVERQQTLRTQQERVRVAVDREEGVVARIPDEELRLAEDLAEEAARNRVLGRAQPSSLSQDYVNTNPSKARAAHEAAARDESGEAARALYGTSRHDAVANDLLPEIGTSNGSVRAKISTPDGQHTRVITPNAEVMRIAKKDGGIYYWQEEKVQYVTKMFEDMQNAVGLTARTGMSSFRMDGTRIHMDMVYGPRHGGWKSAEDALDLAEFALKDFGVTRDRIQLLQRDGARYRQVDPSDIREGDTDFLVRVTQEDVMSSSRLSQMEEADVLRNFFDRSPIFAGKSQGSFMRHILDPASMLHPNITLGANIAVDRVSALERAMINLGEEFASIYRGLPSNRQQAVEQVIKEANYHSQNPSYARLAAEGFSRDEITALRKWREVWDTMYVLENRDLARSLRHAGYRIMEDATTDTRLIARPIHRNRAGDVTRAYDPSTGKIEPMTRQQVDELYDGGGQLASLRNHMEVDGDAVNVVISREKPGGQFLRQLNDDDAVLNYREGYYQVYYKGNWFVERQVVNKAGDVVESRAVSVAGNRKEADLTARQLEDQDGARYIVREDRSKMRMDSKTYWDLQHSQGRSAQRARGVRLQDSTGKMNSGVDHNFVLDPASAMIASVRSMSRRVGMRDYLETSKQRFIRQFEDMLPTDQFGRPRWPNSMDEIVKRHGSQRDKDIADARTTYEYINSLEVGYINGLDEIYKASMRMIADILGRVGFGKGEEAFHYLSDRRGPMQFGKNSAFTMYLALNPLRQAIIQSHQGVQLTANFGPYVARQMVNDVGLMMDMKMTGRAHDFSRRASGRSEAEARAMQQAFEDSGLTAGIDKQNLIRGSLTELAEYAQYTSRAGSAATAPLRWSRKIGFDAGEYLNMLTSWLAHYDRHGRRTGKTFDKFTAEDWDRIAAEARGYTYHMNRAGEMPYNENWMSMVMQFIQVPHKAATQMLTDRTLSRGERARLMGFNALMYGVPSTSIMYTWLDGKIQGLPEELQSAIKQGLEAYLLNKAFSLMAGEDVRINFEGLAAADMTGIFELITSFASTDAGEILAASPGGALFFGHNPRVTEFFKTAARWTNPAWDFETPTTFTQVLHSAAEMSSGYSGFYRARMAREFGLKRNQFGDIVDYDLPVPQQIALMFGFSSQAEQDRRWLAMEVYERTSEFQDDVKKHYRDTKRHLYSAGFDPSTSEWKHRVLSEMNKAWEGSAAAKEIWLSEMRRDIDVGDASLFNGLLRIFPDMDPREARTLARTLPDEELSQELLRIMDYWDNYEDE